MRPWSSLLAIACLLPAAGCCSLARLFCGPDRSPWISVDYRTPEATVRTLLEALRRDQPEVLYECLSDAYRRKLEIDEITFQLVYPKLREQNPGLHVAGYAEVPAAERLGPDRALVRLQIEGQPFEVTLRRERRQGLRWTRANGTPAEPSRALPTFTGAATIAVDPDADTTQVTLAPFVLPGAPAEPPAPDELEFAGLETKWRVDLLRQLQAP
ncbi:MAG: hypothetical protein WAT39_16305 [Planctomycetota bacterium]